MQSLLPKQIALFSNTYRFQQRNITKLTKFANKNQAIKKTIYFQQHYYATKIVVVPQLGDSITDGTVQKWLKTEGQQVAEDEVICQIETAKIAADVRSPGAGVLKKLFAKEGDNVAVGQNLFEMELGATAAAPAAEAPKAAPAPKKEEAAPAKQEEKPKPVAAPAPTPAPAPQPTPVATETTGQPGRVERRVPMSRMRQTIAQRLKDSQNTYALLTTFNEIDMSRLMDMRKRLQDQFAEKHKVKLGFMSAFVKASAVALQEMPMVNAVIDGTDIVYRDYVDVSVAVASPTGLVVPVLRNCESKSFATIEKEIAVYGDKAKNRTLTLPEMQGGTFTISNGGVFGSLMGTPIVNPPQSAILGMHAINKRPVVVNDQIVIRPMMYVALTYDHRIIDGREAVTFLRRIKELIEDPERFLTA
jgi:2-oxoglutarate dehydrogenase E2 component (dihydrolipoamide succinyltransferase)